MDIEYHVVFLARAFCYFSSHHVDHDLVYLESTTLSLFLALLAAFNLRCVM